MPSSIIAALVGALVRGFTWALFTQLFVTNLVLSALSRALTPKPKNSSGVSELRNRTVVIRSSTEPHRIIYGEAPVSGVLLYAESTGSTKEYLHLVIGLAGHECFSIGDIFLNNVLLGKIDSNGNVTSGDYSGWVRVKKYLGTSTQEADSDLVTESDGIWTINHKLCGICYLYVRLKFDSTGKVFSSGIPNVYATVKGKKVYDPRISLTKWSNNWALCLNDYLLSDYGLGCTTSEINQTLLIAAANACDEYVAVATYGSALDTVSADDITNNTFRFLNNDIRIANLDRVTLSTTGTLPTGFTVGTTYYVRRISKTACKLSATLSAARANTFIDIVDAGTGAHNMHHVSQLRYTTNGTFQLSERPVDILQSLLTSAVGTVVWTSGTWDVYAGVYSIPTLHLNSDSLRGPISMRAKTARKELFNAVRGVYAEQWKDWQPTDFPLMENATYAAQDGAVIYRDIELPHTTDVTRAQRIAKIHLEKARQGIVVEMPCKLLPETFKLKVQSSVYVTLTQMGWSNKVFRVLEWKLSETAGIDLLLQEDSSASYDWSAGEATVIDSAPDTIFPNLTVVSPPTGLACFSGSAHQLVQADGLKLCRIYATWTAGADVNIAWYELQYKLTTATDYQSTVVPAVVTTAYLSPLQSGSSYHVRIRALSSVVIPSDWEGPVTIAASSDASTTSVAYADITGTKPPTNADNTGTAVNAGTTVTAAAGGITFSGNGAIKGGQTDYNTGTGWFLGYSGAAYKFSIGNPASNYLGWDGSTLTIVGDVDDKRTYVVGDKILGVDTDSSKNTNSTTLVAYTDVNNKNITFQVNRAGNLRVSALCYCSTTNQGEIQWYKNGATVGSVQSIVATTYGTWLNQDINGFAAGDLITLKFRSKNASYLTTVAGMAIKAANLYPQMFITPTT